ncbi:MAG: aspartate carbamoyltransferase, partial [Candidatus Margulisiibacteriota bacterium]
MTTAILNQKDLLGLKTLSRQDIEGILQQATIFKAIFNRPAKKFPSLGGKVLVSLFYEPSTRTKASFDMAIKLIGASSMSFSVQTSSISKGETLIDTVKNLESMGIDGIIVRHSMGGAPHLIAEHVGIPVINAGDGFNEQPTQALLDLFT